MICAHVWNYFAQNARHAEEGTSETEARTNHHQGWVPAVQSFLHIRLCPQWILFYVEHKVPFHVRIKVHLHDFQ